jgi:hypothetical protein
MDLELKDGKFFRDGQVVPLEFGNPEQIKLMTRRINLINDLETEGVVVYPVIELKATVRFPCMCGNCHVYIEIECSDEDEVNRMFHGEEGQCFSCKKKYRVTHNKKLHSLSVRAVTH